ncbi:unnamed protein product [Tilletia laevis]|uniref:Uncharacterized protein n=1 Tax=Tilletia laevis TaxID=157183 RepID=A0A9N8QFN2_9BASI|nr:unnamed protein product [Tilletia laevis]CAD6962229.1 unnamed protein product [Tilletia caries]
MSAGGPGSQPSHASSSHLGNLISAEKREADEALTTSRKEWLKELEPTFDKALRAVATEKAYSILLAGEDDPKHALTLAIEQINERRALKHALGRELFVSSEPDLHWSTSGSTGPRSTTTTAVEGEIQKEIEQAANLPVQPKDKDKGKEKRLAFDSDSADEDSSTKSESGKKNRRKSKKKKDSSTDSDSSSDSEAGKKKKRRRKQRKVQWQKGKVNRSRHGSLRVSDKIAAKVQKSKYVDMWYFTEEARAMNSGDRPVTKKWSMEGSSIQADFHGQRQAGGIKTRPR